MAEQQAFHPGVSLAGAVDLEALKHQVKAEPGQAGGAPAAGGYVIDTTENTFQAMVQTSATFPILLFLWVPTDDRLFAMARALGDAVNKLNGQIQLSRIDIASNPSIAQAFHHLASAAIAMPTGPQPATTTFFPGCSRSRCRALATSLSVMSMVASTGSIPAGTSCRVLVSISAPA